MSLKTRFKNLGNVLAQDEAQTDVYVLDSPVLTNGMYERIVGFIGEKNIAVIDCTMPIPADEARGGDCLRANLDRIRAEARGCGPARLRPDRADRRGVGPRPGRPAR